MTTWYKWRLSCDTDGYVYMLSETKPTTCPVNTAHSIDAAKTTAIDRRDANALKIQDERVETGGNFQTSSKKMDIPNVVGVHHFNFSEDVPMSLFSINFATEEIHRGDQLTVMAAPDTVVGAITANIALNDTVVTVQQSVIDNLEIGYFARFTDGVNTSSYSVVKSINTVTKQITLKEGSDYAFSAASPTYVQFTAKMMKDFWFGAPRTHYIGTDTLDSSYVPAGKVIRICYTNNSGTAKTFILHYVVKY